MKTILYYVTNLTILYLQVGFLCDLHGHLCEAEVIGLLAGSAPSLR